MAPAPADSTVAFIESDLKKAQTLLVAGLNTTAGYEKGRATRGAATALLGKLYMNRGMYDKAAAEFKKILPEWEMLLTEHIHSPRISGIILPGQRKTTANPSSKSSFTI
jgi:hypothetical protein